MRGNMSGVQAIIRQEVPYTVYIHCYSHRLNLVLVKSVTEIPDLFPEFLSIIQTLIILLQSAIPDA